MEADPPVARGRLGTSVRGHRSWLLLRPLGQGGNGSVYLGEAADDRSLAAIKIYANLSASREEAVHEGAAMRVRDPSTIDVLDAGVTDRGEVWMALDFVRGEDLRTRLERGPVAPRLAAEWMLLVFRVLDVIHRAGVAHGDIKPENLLLEPDGPVRVVDFGRARLHCLWGGEGTFPGTPPYMHPALFRGGTAEPHTDCFAAWVTLYELVLGERPYATTTLRTHQQQELPAPRPLRDEALERVIRAGLDGTLGTARLGWVALSRYLRGRTDLPRSTASYSPPDLRDVQWALQLLQKGRSGALIGFADDTRSVLEEVHRAAERKGTTVLWVRADWGRASLPLSAALGLVGHAADSLDVPTLRVIAEGLGPLGAALASRLPAARTWIPSGPLTGTPSGAAAGTSAGSPTGDSLRLAIQAFLAALPRPIAIFVDRIDLVDGASRRFLATLLGAGDLVILGTAGPRGPHGLGTEREVAHRTRSLELAESVDDRHRAVLDRAAGLDLPFGPTLATAMGVSEAVVVDAALECEARGLARWNGTEVLARPVQPPPPEQIAGWSAEAARRLDGVRDPLLVAGYASAGGDGDRLAEVIEAAVEEALVRDPEAALALLDKDPRPRTPARVLRHFHVAVLARNKERVRALHEELARTPGATGADVAEADGEVHFRAGEVVPALAAYRRAVAALGRPVGEGSTEIWELVRALWRFRTSTRAPPRPDPRLGRMFERLHDLTFTHHHRPMLRVHELWLEAAPLNPRARAMDVVWQTAFGWHARAHALEETLLHQMDEERDPIGYAVVLLHRAIARTWRGETRAAFNDAVDAGEALQRGGDSYLVALSQSTLAVCAIHLGEPDRLLASVRKTLTICEIMGDARGESWARAGQAVWCWLQGQNAEAVAMMEQLGDECRRRDDCSETVARRFLAEVHAEEGRYREAIAEAERARELIARYGLQMDFYLSYAIAGLTADAQARLAGDPGLGWWRRFQYRRVVRSLLSRSPRWHPRARTMEAWQRVATGDRDGARRGFEAALQDARDRDQPNDQWIVLTAWARALGDPAVAEQAAALAARVGLKNGGAA